MSVGASLVDETGVGVVVVSELVLRSPVLAGALFAAFDFVFAGVSVPPPQPIANAVAAIKIVYKNAFRFIADLRCKMLLNSKATV